MASRRFGGDGEPTFRELATDWLDDRQRNPGIRPSTTARNEWELTRYLAPFFGELRPSQITPLTIKQYRRRIQLENETIRTAAEAGAPLRDPRNSLPLRTISNDSINKTIQTLAMILDEAEDAGWIERNVARGRRTREPTNRPRNHGVLETDELLALFEAADDLERRRHSPRTLERAAVIRALRDDAELKWKDIASRLDIAVPTAIYLHGCVDVAGAPIVGVRRAIIATLAFAGPRVGELCALNVQDVDLAHRRLHIADSKTAAGVRTIDIHARLAEELAQHRAVRGPATLDAPEFASRTGSRRDKDNVRRNVIASTVARANELRLARDELPIRTHVTPHTFRRTYITYLVAAGFDIPYIQAQVGHRDPTMTLGVYAQVMHRSERDQLRHEIRHLLGLDNTAEAPEAATARTATAHTVGAVTALRSAETAGKGRAIGR